MSSLLTTFSTTYLRARNVSPSLTICPDLRWSPLIKFTSCIQPSHRKPVPISHGTSLLLIPYWQSSHAEVAAVKKDIKAVVGDYLDALESSFELARHAITFADNTICLCQSYKQKPIAAVRKFANEMGEMVYRQPIGVCQKFACVRRGLLQVCIRSWLHHCDGITSTIDH